MLTHLFSDPCEFESCVAYNSFTFRQYTVILWWANVPTRINWTTPLASECVAVLGRVLHDGGERCVALAEFLNGNHGSSRPFLPLFNPLRLSRIIPSSSSSTTATPRWCPCGCAAAWRRGELSRASDPADLHGCSLTLRQHNKQNIIPVKCFCCVAAVRQTTHRDPAGLSVPLWPRCCSAEPNVPGVSRWPAPDWSPPGATRFRPPVLYCWQPFSECWGFRLWVRCPYAPHWFNFLPQLG